MEGNYHSSSFYYFCSNIRMFLWLKIQEKLAMTFGTCLNDMINISTILKFVKWVSQLRDLGKEFASFLLD